ncbi:MAG: DNA double-strand break repair nuclease NurA [Dehalococcoidia bacterium]
MPLDLAQIAARIEDLAAKLKAEEKGRVERLQQALQLLQSVDIKPLKDKIAASNTTWLVAGLTTGLAQHYEAPTCPAEFTVLATDGSHIDVDRHSSVRCSVINIGSVTLQYGQYPDASLESEASLFFGDDLVITGPAGREEPIEGALLGVKRSVEELRALAGIAQELPCERPTLALIDGSLILWGLAARDFEGTRSHVREELLYRGYLDALDRMKRCGEKKNLALASYISYPRSTDVVNVLRVALCPHEPADCDQHCSQGGQRECDAVVGIRDSDLFQALLSYRERSPIFISGSRFMQRHYREHQVHFFYLKLDEEIARVEIPSWVAENSGLIDLVHSLVLDQCQRGHGYPVALMEAHEKAVVTNADRERFWQLVELSLAEDRLYVRSSGKSQSKRLRWI